MVQLTLFYDGTCPLCAKEIAALRGRDAEGLIQVLDISRDDISAYPQIDVQQANRILHGIDDKGVLLLGLDVTHRAWQLVGKGWLYAPLRWPLVRPIADRCYLLFANNRYRVSWWLTGRAKCDGKSCSR